MGARSLRCSRSRVRGRSLRWEGITSTLDGRPQARVEDARPPLRRPRLPRRLRRRAAARADRASRLLRGGRGADQHRQARRGLRRRRRCRGR